MTVQVRTELWHHYPTHNDLNVSIQGISHLCPRAVHSLDQEGHADLCEAGWVEQRFYLGRVLGRVTLVMSVSGQAG